MLDTPRYFSNILTECYIATSSKGNLASLREVLGYPTLGKLKGGSNNVRITQFIQNTIPGSNYVFTLCQQVSESAESDTCMLGR